MKTFLLPLRLLLCIFRLMPAKSLEKLKKTREDLKRRVAAYISDLDNTHAELRREAEALRDGLENKGHVTTGENLGWPSPKGRQKPKSPIVIDAINNLNDTITANEVLAIIKHKKLGDHVRGRDVRRVLSRIANRNDSPLQLTNKGKGTAPNVYRKVRHVEGL